MRSFVLAVTCAAGLAACASNPAPVETAPPPSAPTPRDAPTAPRPPVPEGPVPGSIEDFQVSIGDRVYFEYDSHALTPQARNVLARQAEWLQRYPGVRVMVAGNCDERGTREYNFALGARRAAAAKDYLVALGVAGDRIETVSYGKERPINPASSEEAWSVNRNAHTQIISGAVS